jgi:hypothetical protein
MMLMEGIGIIGMVFEQLAEMCWSLRCLTLRKSLDEGKKERVRAREDVDLIYMTVVL